MSVYRPIVNLYGHVWNEYVRMTQSYFRGDPMENERMYDWYSTLYDMHIPTKGDNKRLLQYMERYGLSWSDLDFKKTIGHFGNGTVDGMFGALNFVSDNVRSLYRDYKHH